jgi:hypothetical protein
VKPLIHAGVNSLFTQPGKFAQADVSLLWEAWETRGVLATLEAGFPKLQTSTTAI